MPQSVVYFHQTRFQEVTPRPMRLPKVISFAAALLWSCWAQQPRTNAFDTAEGAAQGGVLFQTHCTYCHGARGEGGRGADLTTGQYRYGGSDASLYNTIRNGVPGTEMPSVRATDDDVWKMVAFVRKLVAAAVTEKAS